MILKAEGFFLHVDCLCAVSHLYCFPFSKSGSVHNSFDFCFCHSEAGAGPASATSEISVVMLIAWATKFIRTRCRIGTSPLDSHPHAALQRNFRLRRPRRNLQGIMCMSLRRWKFASPARMKTRPWRKRRYCSRTVRVRVSHGCHGNIGAVVHMSFTSTSEVADLYIGCLSRHDSLMSHFFL